MADSIKIFYHPTYQKTNKFYTKAEALVSYDEDDVVNQKFVTKYSTEIAQEAKEGSSSYPNRLARTYSLTFTDSTLAQHVTTCAQQVAVIGFGSDEEGDKETTEDKILDDVTGFGHSTSDFLREQLGHSFLYGMHCVLISRSEATAETEEQKVLLNERSYLFLYKPQAVIYWSYFYEGSKRGQLKELVLEDESVGDKRRFRRYIATTTGHTWQILESDLKTNLGFAKEVSAILIEQGESTVSRIPAVIFGSGGEDSLLKKSVHLDLAQLNRQSTYSNVNFYQGFRQTIVAGIADVSNAMKQISESIISFVTGNNVVVHEIPAGDPVGLETEIRMIQHWNRRLSMYQLRQVTDDLTKQSPSAESKAKDLQVLSKIYNTYLNYFERKLTEVWRIVAEFEGFTPEKVAKIQVRIARDLDLTDSEFDLQRDQFLLVVASMLGAQSKAAIAKQIARRYLSDLRILPNEGKDEEQTRKELLKLIEDEQAQLPVSQGLGRSNLFQSLTTTNSTDGGQTNN